MVNIEQLRNIDHKILCVGSHPAIIQSILDFDYLSGKNKPSVVAIIAGGRKYERYFYGKKEVAVPVFSSTSNLPAEIKESITLFINLSSGRRALNYSQDVLQIPSVLGGVIFAEDVPEEHALTLYRKAKVQNKFLVGPASVGVLIPNILKLGAVGGVDYRQFVESKLFIPGNVAVFSASGGMTNELIRIVTQQNKRVSFALAFGGDRFPLFQPVDAFMLAQEDPSTETIIYFGELGGTDEYDIAELLKEGKITKKVIVYIAGVISDYFEEPPQFGHAKAMAKNKGEGAKEKSEALREAGAIVAQSFDEFIKEVESLTSVQSEEKSVDTSVFENRQPSVIASTISGDVDGVTTVLGEDLLSMAKNHSFAAIVSSMFLGRKIQSKEFENFVDFILRILVEHGPYVSGAVNTIVTARAGRDLSSSLAAGILTVGPRFGGAINQAAANWINGVVKGLRPIDFVEDFAKKREYIAGIGHRKYRVDFPDPRVREILKFAEQLEKKRFTNFAQSVEDITVGKKGNLILNVDGTIAAVLLDILAEKEGYSDEQLHDLVQTEFFNALFILSRSVGFMSHFLDQKRIDEGLFRLPNKLVADLSDT